MKNWALRSEQFGALWAETGQDRIPDPFDVLSSIPTRDDYEVEQRQIRAEFAGAENDELRSVLRVLAEPDVYAEISGITFDEAPIRIIGCQRQNVVAIAVQRPGPRSHVGGDVVLGSGPAGRLAAQLIGQIPQNAGGRRTFQRLGSGEEEEYGYSVLQQVNAVASTPRFEDAAVRAHAGNGTILVQRGPRYGRGRDIGHVRWFDLAADGRYVIRSKDPTAVHACTPEKLVLALDSLLREGTE